MSQHITKTNEKISGKLMKGVLHYFSYVVYCEVGGDKKYYKLRPLYFKEHKPKPLFRQWWAVIRRQDIDKLSDSLARNIFKRAVIRPIQVKYMTTASRTVDGVLKRQQHVIGVRLNESDFRFLEEGGYLGETKMHLIENGSIADPIPQLRKLPLVSAAR